VLTNSGESGTCEEVEAASAVCVGQLGTRSSTGKVVTGEWADDFQVLCTNAVLPVLLTCSYFVVNSFSSS
jgi:hypothetical protein